MFAAAAAKEDGVDSVGLGLCANDDAVDVVMSVEVS